MEKQIQKQIQMAAASCAFALFSGCLNAAENTENAESVEIGEIVVQEKMPSNALAPRIAVKESSGSPAAGDAAQFLAQLPGFSQIRKGGKNGEVVLRGMTGSRVGLLVDGAEIYGTCYSRMDSPASYIFPELYDSAEIVKGPQTVSKGPGYGAGVVAFVRKKPEFSAGKPWQISGSLAGGSLRRHSEMLDFSVGSGKMYWRTTFNQTGSGDYKDGAGKKVHSSYRQYGVESALGFTPDADTRIEISGNFTDGAADYADRYEDAVRLERVSGKIYAEKKFHSILDKITLEAGKSRGFHVMDNFSRRRQHPDWNGVLMVMNPQNRIHHWRAQADWQPHAQWKIKTGADGRQMNFFERDPMPMFYPGYADTLKNLGLPEALWPEYAVKGIDYRRYAVKQNNREKKTGIFIESEYYADENGRHKIAGGFRLDRHEMAGNSFSGRSHKSHTLKSGFIRYENRQEKQNFYIGVGHNQRMLDFSEAWWVNPAVAGTLSLAGLKPEKLTQIDAGYQWQNGKTSLSLSGFYGKTKDYLYIVWLPASGVRNIEAERFGLEGEAQWHFHPDWTVAAGISWVRGFNRTDHSPLAQQPPLEANLTLSRHREKLRINGRLRAVAAQKHYDKFYGSIDGFDKGRAPGFATVSLDAQYQIGKKWQLSAGVDNLFNRRYYEHLSTFASTGTPTWRKEDYTAKLYEPGRSLWARINFQF